MRRDSEDVRRLRRLWDEHIHRPFPDLGDDPSSQEVALYAAWLGSIVEAVLRRGALDRLHADMLKIRRAEGNRELFLPHELRGFAVSSRGPLCFVRAGSWAIQYARTWPG